LNNTYGASLYGTASVNDGEWLGKCFMVAVREESPVVVIKASAIANGSWTDSEDCSWNKPEATYKEVTCPDIL